MGVGVGEEGGRGGHGSGPHSQRPRSGVVLGAVGGVAQFDSAAFIGVFVGETAAGLFCVSVCLPCC